MVGNGDAGFTKPSPQDQRGWLWFVTILSVIYSFSFFGARLFGKYGLLWYDDAVLAGSYALAVARWGLMMTAIACGLGAELNMLSNQSRGVPYHVSRLVFSGRILLMLCLYLSKLSIALFTRKVFSGNLSRENLIFGVYFSVLATSGIASILIESIGCHPPLLLLDPSDKFCSNNTARSVVVCVLDIVTELFVMAVPLLLVSRIHMQTSQKVRVFALFAFRVGVIAFAVAETSTYLDRNNGSIGYAGTVVLQELLLCYSFISCTIPCMRSFVAAFASSFLVFAGFGTTYDGSQRSRSRSRSHGPSSIALRSLTKKESTGALRLNNTQLRPDFAQYDVDIMHGRMRQAEEGDSVRSDGSERMIIRRHTDIQVQST